MFKRIFPLLLLISSFLFVIPSSIKAYCEDAGQCGDPPISENCEGASVQCINNECSYSYQCTGSCSDWGDWSPEPCTTGQQQTRFCTGNPALFQIQNCGSGGGGGGYQGQTCPGGTTLTCGTPNLYTTAGDLTSDHNLAQCTFLISCDANFPSSFNNNGCGGNEVKGICQDNCGCCASGSTYQATQIVGATYTKELTCHAPISNSNAQCSDWDDTYVIGSRVIGGASSNCYCKCESDLGCGANCNQRGGSWRKNDLVTCQSITTTWSCHTNCTTSSPSVPALISPSNGVVISTTSNNLTWNTNGQTWGTGCPSNNNNYYLYVGPTSGSLTLAGSATQASGTSSIPVTRSAGTYYWQVRASNGSVTTNSPIWSFTITDAEPWWQVKDGDLTTNGDISSSVPTGQLFDTVGLGGFPGVPVYGNAFNLSSDTSRVSTTRWHSDTTTIQSRIFNYAFFDNLIPDDVNFNDVSTLVSGGTSYTDGYEWYTATGDVGTSGDINIGNRKVILFVENGNFNINGRINVNDGVGFFGVFVDGNISIDPAVVGAPSIEGVYLSNNFSTGVGTSQLHVRGSVATFGTVNLQRDLTVDTTPAELFEFAPDQMLLFPEKLMFRRTKWTEVAP